MTGPSDADLLAAFGAALADGTLSKLVLSGPLDEQAPPKGVVARPVVLKAGPRLQIVERLADRDRTRNLDAAAANAEIAALLSRYGHANLLTTSGTWTLDRRPGRPPKLSRSATQQAAPPPSSHDREKKRMIGGPEDWPWLEALGICLGDGRPRRDQEHKLRQLQRFVEQFSHVVAKLPPPDGRPLRVVDMGCGKGHLAFAVHAWLRRSGFPEAEVVGVELRPHLVDAANRLAPPGLSFVAGTIADAPLDGVDVVVALHACDTATDDALLRAVQAGAQAIFAAPCCHREVRREMGTPADLGPALKHGILREREAEWLTDALRAALLGAVGYDAQVAEFVPTEHTPRNLLIAAVRRGGGDPARAAEARRLAAFFGVGRQRLAEGLGIALTEEP